MAKKKAPEEASGAETAQGASPAAGEKPAKPKAAKGESARKEEAGPQAAKPAAVEGEKKKARRPGKSPHRGKKLRNQIKNQAQRLRKEGAKPLTQALELLKKMKRAKFDETVEVHMSLGIDTTQSDQMIRGTVSLPHGIGKSVRVLVFCQGDNVQKAVEAGADHAGGDELITRIQKDGWTDFDVALATQDMMGKVSRLGKVLGPRGLMPTPKAGTVITSDVGQVVKEFKAGKVEYRSDKTGNVHAGVGKMSFEAQKLAENITTFVDQIRAVKPSGVKGNYIQSIYVSATMSPGIQVSM